jgi:hypothetical protein
VTSSSARHEPGEFARAQTRARIELMAVRGRAVRTVADQAVDPDDFHSLLSMLGLDADADSAASLRRVETGPAESAVVVDYLGGDDVVPAPATVATFVTDVIIGRRVCGVRPVFSVRGNRDELAVRLDRYAAPADSEIRPIR